MVDILYKKHDIINIHFDVKFLNNFLLFTSLLSFEFLPFLVINKINLNFLNFLKNTRKYNILFSINY